jgi:hypothetical protein
MRFIGSRSCTNATAHADGGFSAVIWFDPYRVRRDAASAVANPFDGSESSSDTTTAASRAYGAGTIDPSNPHRVWVTVSQPGAGLVFRSDNGGAGWVNCTAGLPNIPVNSVVVDPANYKRVWVAADVGVYETLNLGSSWASFSNGLPNAMAADLLFHKQDRMLICATRNRGAWALHVP